MRSWLRALQSNPGVWKELLVNTLSLCCFWCFDLVCWFLKGNQNTSSNPGLHCICVGAIGDQHRLAAVFAGKKDEKTIGFATKRGQTSVYLKYRSYVTISPKSARPMQQTVSGSTCWDFEAAMAEGLLLLHHHLLTGAQLIHRGILLKASVRSPRRCFICRWKSPKNKEKTQNHRESSTSTMKCAGNIHEISTLHEGIVYGLFEEQLSNTLLWNTGDPFNFSHHYLTSQQTRWKLLRRKRQTQRDESSCSVMPNSELMNSAPRKNTGVRWREREKQDQPPVELPCHTKGSSSWFLQSIFACQSDVSFKKKGNCQQLKSQKNKRKTHEVKPKLCQ